MEEYIKKYKSLQIFVIENFLSLDTNIKTYITVGFHSIVQSLLAYSLIDQ